jgi:hypothetical protein
MESNLTPASARLFRIRKTAGKMLRNRGYEVPDSIIDMTAEEFKTQFPGEPIHRPQLDIEVAKPQPEGTLADVPEDDKLMVFFAEGDLSIKACKP